MSFMLMTIVLMAPTTSVDPRALTTPELQRLLRDAWFHDPDIPEDKGHLDQPEYFLPGGHYERHDDRYEAVGSYRFANNQVCVTTGIEEEVCRTLFVDSSGQLWISQPGSERLRRIAVRKMDR